MTKVQTTLRSAYLAGPMRGYEHYNFPAFHKAAAKLRADDWSIFSPAERDEADPSINARKENGDYNEAGWADHKDLGYFMQFDLAAVCTNDAVICLPDWEKSQGARLETAVAVEIGHPVFEFVPKRFGKYELKSVNPSYIQSIFALNATAGPLHDEAVPEEPLDGCQGPCGNCECATGASFLQETEELADFMIQGGPVWQVHEVPVSALPHDSAGRKAVPLASGVLDYFPAALAEVARVSKAGNDKHNPGQAMHHARGKSTDHADCLLRHLVDRGKMDPETGQRHSAEVAWRALALLQQELEDEGLAPLPRGARLS